MNIVFMGTPGFAVPSLRILLEHRYRVSCVVTAPDKPRGRGQKISPAPVKQFALQHSLSLLQPESLGDPAFLSRIQDLRPDLMIVVAFRILPPELYSLASRGAFNLHASLLPKYRGAAPVNWAIINGEQETGVTTFFLRETVDTGSVILQARVRIHPDETAGELHDKLADVGAEIVLQTVRLIEQGKVRPRAQDDSKATPAPKLFKDDCRISWKKPAVVVHNFVRGLSPVPGAWTVLRDIMIRIYRTRPDTGSLSGREPGSVVEAGKDSFRIQTGDGTVTVLELQQEGRKRMPAAEFLRGFSLNAGDRFEE